MAELNMSVFRQKKQKAVSGRPPIANAHDNAVHMRCGVLAIPKKLMGTLAGRISHGVVLVALDVDEMILWRGSASRHLLPTAVRLGFNHSPWQREASPLLSRPMTLTLASGESGRCRIPKALETPVVHGNTDRCEIRGLHMQRASREWFLLCLGAQGEMHDLERLGVNWHATTGRRPIEHLSSRKCEHSRAVPWYGVGRFPKNIWMKCKNNPQILKTSPTYYYHRK